MSEEYTREQDHATDLLTRVLMAKPTVGQIELPSGRRVDPTDPEYCEWLFMSLWRTDERVAEWFGVQPETVTVLREQVGPILDSVGAQFRWQQYFTVGALLAGILPGIKTPLAPERVSFVSAQLDKAIRLACSQGMNVVAAMNIDRHMPRATARPDVTTSIYFAARGDVVKIGRSDSPAKRVANIASQCGERVQLLVSIPAAWEDEKRAHVLFAGDRTIGEWFKRSSEMLALVSLASADAGEALRVIRLEPSEALAILRARSAS